MSATPAVWTDRHGIHYDGHGVPYVGAGRPAPETFGEAVTCWRCGRTWDDAVVTGVTPAPSARCPFEAFHNKRKTVITVTLESDDYDPDDIFNGKGGDHDMLIDDFRYGYRLDGRTTGGGGTVKYRVDVKDRVEEGPGDE